MAEYFKYFERLRLADNNERLYRAYIKVGYAAFGG